ncbi:Fic family protein [Variovorax sp. PvP013]|jgi:cell filamentation protein|uniref:Fic family protein n=1 Tax=Variovorax sp. PvP013 TaxID=3156435 RepID=UPI002CB63F09|nr:Fic family protein [Variovorax sp.]
MPFDPFGDFDTAGYLRNIEHEKDMDLVKAQEKVFFEAHLEEALCFLRAIRGPITHAHFRRVHAILFEEFYPWAGRDRRELGVATHVSKGGIVDFEQAERIGKAMQWGLDMGNSAASMRRQPGAVMGAFAWAHPFLDGNGRTMMLVHTELCRRAGILVDWPATSKMAYLTALTTELKDPGAKQLDAYLAQFVRKWDQTDDLVMQLRALPGLDGLAATSADDIAYDASDEKAMASYLETKRARGETRDLTGEAGA